MASRSGRPPLGRRKRLQRKPPQGKKIKPSGSSPVRAEVIDAAGKAENIPSPTGLTGPTISGWVMAVQPTASALGSGFDSRHPPYGLSTLIATMPLRPGSMVGWVSAVQPTASALGKVGCARHPPYGFTACLPRSRRCRSGRGVRFGPFHQRAGKAARRVLAVGARRVNMLMILGGLMFLFERAVARFRA